jgi:PIN domain nuclease of toxin-antitoxin system
VTYIIDTHTIVWFLEGQKKVGPQALKILRDPQQRLVIPSIVLGEIKYLAARGRIKVTIDKVVETIENDPRCVIYPLDFHVIQAMPVISDIHDGIICGTALLYQNVLGETVKILTRDEKIKDTPGIQTIW